MANLDESHFKFLTENSADIICRVGPDTKLRYVSPASFQLLGWRPEEMTAMAPLALVCAEDLPVVVAAVNRRNVSMEAVPPLITCRMLKKDGSLVWVEVTSRVMHDTATGELIETVITIRDISERKLLQEQLSTLARTDGLTGLANRRAFDEALEREWKRTSREGSHLSLLLLDIDRFKQFNDQYGHQVGDDCLRMVAAAVRDRVQRASDVVARYGGEEIAVILPGTGADSAVEVAEAVRQAVAALRIPHRGNWELGGVVTASIGAATVLARHGGRINIPESLLMSADHALYKAKHEGRNRVATAMLMASQEAVGESGLLAATR